MQGAPPLASPGLNPRGTGSPCRCGALRGLALLAACCPCLWFAFLPPIPPPPFPGGEGGVLRLFYARGSAPCIPEAEPARHWGRGRTTHPAGGVPSESPTRRKTDRTAFLLAKPAAKERGDRGRGTSAFEMVLSPGAGKASAAWVQLPPPPADTTAARSASAARGGGGTPPSPPLTPVKTVKSW